ncbi:unnamed protein product [Darwinula stevensoni]|uniref:Hexosyltransferase n=1 Tax=Darwinula stevensoni TaxID=69355 RepID=A0A7R9A2Q1_9CRUS|nr:unnamed protein product [Darwinula stevensoni]CAG0880410.1 unnamed protein product [Darwinula stevensoni]
MVFQWPSCSEKTPPLHPNLSTSQYQEKFLLTAVIISAPGNFQHREVIRQTWLQACPVDFKHLFVVGSEGLDSRTMGLISEEMKKHEDLLLLPIHDSYQNLTSKVLQAITSVLGLLQTDYILKCDDDSFVQVVSLMEHLRQAETPRTKFYWGFFSGNAKVYRTGRWKEEQWNHCNSYLPYARGGGYVISHDLGEFLARNKEDLAQFSSEDVSVGAWLAFVKGLQRVHDRRFDTEYKSRGCWNLYLVTHKQTTESMVTLWQNLQTQGKLCTQESSIMFSYEYNWNVQPSHCCVRNVSDISSSTLS